MNKLNHDQTKHLKHRPLDNPLQSQVCTHAAMQLTCHKCKPYRSLKSWKHSKVRQTWWGVTWVWGAASPGKSGGTGGCELCAPPFVCNRWQWVQPWGTHFHSQFCAGRTSDMLAYHKCEAGYACIVAGTVWALPQLVDSTSTVWTALKASEFSLVTSDSTIEGFLTLQWCDCVDLMSACWKTLCCVAWSTRSWYTRMLLTGATQVSKIQTQPQMFCRTHVTLRIAAGAQQLQMDKRILAGIHLSHAMLLLAVYINMNATNKVHISIYVLMI